ncbi:unnamed protein product [Chondrus crispus]|uniref:Uncharacterized protein n=1 Tax=Chondrus crispus TaxID=2769 RepID=R7Q593_CHOCR|nr:unnamed protein product [Chondrus crispus]CDF32998.1 unnamed protein product [Chondrus crispus]|eukprot:XP_005712801.1 unnamed protein product [Chondrus crispus]
MRRAERKSRTNGQYIKPCAEGCPLPLLACEHRCPPPACTMSLLPHPSSSPDLRGRHDAAPDRRLLAVPDCLESSTTTITEAGSDAEPLASLSNRNGSPTITIFTGGDDNPADSGSASFEESTKYKIMPKRRDEWELQNASNREVQITATKKRSHVFEISRFSGAQGTRTTFRLVPTGKKLKAYDLVREGEENSCCTITVESKHAWSYRIACKPGADDVIALFSFWLVAMSTILPEPRSPRSLFGLRGRSHEKNHMAMQTVA